jgi:hypothetical protein
VIGATREEFKVEQQENQYHQVSKLEHFSFGFNDGLVGECWEDRLSKSTAVPLRQRASSDSQVRGTDVVFHPVE